MREKKVQYKKIILIVFVGALHVITNTLILNGVISANGDNPVVGGYHRAGGSGGSVSA